MDGDTEEVERRDAALLVVAEMQLTSEQLKAQLRALKSKFGRFGDEFRENGQKHEEQIAKEVNKVSQQLGDRAAKELQHLPFPT